MYNVQDQLAGLNQQNKELESKLQAAKAGQPGGGSKPHAVSPSPASSGARASRPGSATRGELLGSGSWRLDSSPVLLDEHAF